MVEITVKDSVYGTAIILLITFLGVEITDSENWYFCEVENSLKECSKLTSYGVPNAKCIGIDGINDICTANKTYYNWASIENYVNLTIDKKIIIESLQDCHLEFFNFSEDIYINCTKYYEDDTCLDYNENGSCDYLRRHYYESSCYNHSVIIKKNRTVCNPKGFNITYPDNSNYEITGECCGYFNDSKQIVCKKEINGICNPVCQQTSLDPNEYDEYCMIYNIDEKEVVPKRVGEYDFVDNYQIKISDLKRKIK